MLKEKFDGAHEVRQKRKNGRRMLLPRFHRFKPHTDTDLVYLQTSPDYCEYDVNRGSLGTHGRECDPVRFNSDYFVELGPFSYNPASPNVMSQNVTTSFLLCAAVLVSSRIPPLSLFLLHKDPSPRFQNFFVDKLVVAVFTTSDPNDTERRRCLSSSSTEL